MLRKIYFTIVGLLLCTIIHAQLDSQTIRTYQKVLSSRTITTSPQSGFATANTSITLKANNDGTKAVAHIAIPLECGKNLTTFFVNLEQKVSGTSISKPLTLNGLSNGGSFNFGFQTILDNKNDISFSSNQNAYLAKKNKARLSGKKIENYSPDDYRQLNASSFVINKMYVGAKFGLTQESFDYLEDTISFKRIEGDSRTGLNFSFTMGWLFKDGTIAATFSVKRIFEIGDPSTFLFPVQNSPIQIQQEFSVGSPVKTNDQALRVEFMSIGNSEKQAIVRINPNINASFQTKRIGFELPVFFLSHIDEDKKINLNGGIYGQYITDTKYSFQFNRANWGLGVFIGGNINDLFK